MDEVWRGVVGYDWYEVSSAGRVRDVRTGRVFVGSVNSGGYALLRLASDGDRRRMFYVHRLVCTAFHGLPSSPNLVVNHLNGRKTDNRSSNLQWCTRAENNAHAAKMGFFRGCLAGAKNPLAKLSDEVVVEMRRRSRGGASYTALAGQFGVAVSTAYSAVVGRTWTHLPHPPAQFELVTTQ